MRNLVILISILVLCSSHDMFLKMGTYFLDPEKPSSIHLFNGTFEISENAITRDRMIDVSLVGGGKRISVDTSQWIDQGDTTVLNFITGVPGTWVAGVSTGARHIELSATDFNEYLKHDGVLDMLALRDSNNTMDSSAVEEYSKHVKAIFQVGKEKSNDWNTILGYPIEFVPLSNPYDLQKGDTFSTQLLRNNEPLPNQLVYVGSTAHMHESDDQSTYEHSHEAENSEEHHHDALQLQTDDEGVVTMTIAHDGHWYLRTIHMERSEAEGLTHESNWATLTFEVGHRHGDGLPKYLFAILGLAVIAILYRKLKKS